MSVRVLEEDLWPTITKLARESNRGSVAVAYLGKGARKLLPLHSGDNLVIDMSLETVKSGQTNPFEVEIYLEKGVKVYTCANLHAKIYVFDKTVIAGSANVSKSSKYDLIEVGLQCQDPDALAQARGFIKSLQTEAVTPEYVKLCKKLYQPPRFHRTITREGKPKTPIHSPIWVLGVVPLRTLSEREERIYDVAGEKAVKKIKDAERFKLDSIKWPDKKRVVRRLGEGHLIVQAYDDGKNVKVHHYSRVIQITRYLDDKKKPWMIIWIEVPKHKRTLTWKEFEKRMKLAGISHLGRSPARLIRNPKIAHTILGLWS